MRKLTLLINALSIFALAGWLSACNDDDPAPTAVVGVQQEAIILAEDSSSPATVTFTITPGWATDVTIPLVFSGTAIEGVDYQSVSPKSVTIPAGSTSASISITPLNNNFVDEGRTIIITPQDPSVAGVTLTQPAETTVTLQDDEVAGAVIVDFEAASYTTNEYNQETVTVPVNLNTAFAEDATFTVTVGGTATSGTNYSAFTSEVTIPAGETSAVIEVPVIDSKSYGETSTIELTLDAPENEVFTIGANNMATINIINPVANTALFAPSDAFGRLWAYNTFADEPVPATGRLNTDPTLGTVFDESFAFVYYPLADNPDPNADPNVFGFQADAWTEADFTKSTNIYNILELYGDDTNPNTIDTGISGASAGLREPAAFRLVPDAVGSTTGKVYLIDNEVRVYYPDNTDDGVVNPEFYTLTVTGEGTYDETTGVIEIPLTFDGSAVGDGVKTRQFVFQATRRE